MHYEIIKDAAGSIFGIHKKNSGDPVDESLVITDEELIQALLTNNAQTVSLIYYDNLSSSVKPRLPNMAIPNKLDELTLLADGTDTFVLTGLPIPCTVTVDDATYEVNDGEFGFPTTLPGTYIVKASAFPYVEKTWEVIAV